MKRLFFRKHCLLSLFVSSMTTKLPNNLPTSSPSCHWTQTENSHLETNQPHVLCHKTLIFRGLLSLHALLVCIWYMLQCFPAWQLWTSVIVLDRVGESGFSCSRSALCCLCQSWGSMQSGWDGSARDTVGIKWLFCNDLSVFHFVGDRIHLKGLKKVQLLAGSWVLMYSWTKKWLFCFNLNKRHEFSSDILFLVWF